MQGHTRQRIVLAVLLMGCNVGAQADKPEEKIYVKGFREHFLAFKIAALPAAVLGAHMISEDLKNGRFMSMLRFHILYSCFVAPLLMPEQCVRAAAKLQNAVTKMQDKYPTLKAVSYGLKKTLFAGAKVASFVSALGSMYMARDVYHEISIDPGVAIPAGGITLSIGLVFSYLLYKSEEIFDHLHGRWKDIATNIDRTEFV